jgi:IS30 family transposase
MASVSQDRGDIIAERLNTRPRKRLDYLAPEEACDLFRD